MEATPCSSVDAMSQYFEPQYKILDEANLQKGLAVFGPMSSFTWNTDPKRLLFVLSRYKFAARMLEGCKQVIEVGCGDGFASRIVRQHVESLLLTDADPLMIEYCEQIQSQDFPATATCHNFATSPLTDYHHSFDGAYLLDVLEHIDRHSEPAFFANLLLCLKPNAKVVIGMPSLESQAYASEGSKAGHVNCKTKEDLFRSLSLYFCSVSCFSMNDEVVHTGFNRLANYLMAVCIV